MATYTIGDVQGCFTALQRLLDRIRFNPPQDRLWFVGDLVNRGSESVAVLRFVRSLGRCAVTVLGNHDLHALALAAGLTPRRSKDSLHDLVYAEDRDELLDWLRRQPLMHVEDSAVLVHAGLLPSWTVTEARGHAREVEHVLRSNEYAILLQALYADQSREMQWSEDLYGLPRLCAITNALTKLRVCTPGGGMELSYKGPLDQVPDGLVPWFQFPNRKSAGALIICGHWSAMGLRVDRNFVCLDSGCIWGGLLTAFRLDDRKVFQVSCTGAQGQEV